MTPHDYILTKQVAWAQARGLTLIGSQGERGRPAYTRTLDENLFAPLLPDVRQSFADGDGNELGGSATPHPQAAPAAPCKMQALHSSSALGVNVFQY